MSASDSEALGPQVFGQFALHLRRRLEGHGIVHFVHFGQQPNAVAPHKMRRFDPLLVIEEPRRGIKPSHSDVNTGLGRIAPGIFRAHFAQLGDCRIQQHDINVMMVRGRGTRPQSAECFALHCGSLAKHASPMRITALPERRSGKPSIPFHRRA
jgi:hypothetical protein